MYEFWTSAPIVIIVDKLIRSKVLRGGARLQGAGMGKENFSHYVGQDEDGVKQNYARRGQRPHPLDPPHSIVIPRLRKY